MLTYQHSFYFMFFDKIAKIVSLSFDVSVFTSPVSTLLNNELIIISRYSLLISVPALVRD